MEHTLETILAGLADQAEKIAEALSAPQGAFQSNAGMGDRVIVEVIRPEDRADESSKHS